MADDFWDDWAGDRGVVKRIMKGIQDDNPDFDQDVQFNLENRLNQLWSLIYNPSDAIKDAINNANNANLSNYANFLKNFFISNQTAPNPALYDLNENRINIVLCKNFFNDYFKDLANITLQYQNLGEVSDLLIVIALSKFEYVLNYYGNLNPS